MDPSERFMELSRFWVQRIFVPIVVVLGVVGNFITVVILTQRRMRSSTNVYLTALAIADLIYLLFVLILSFEHYGPHIHNVKYSLYWRFYGITHWLVDAASSSSIWLTVSFTIERYIAVCHPIRGKVLCTERRAKRVTAIVCILVVLSLVSTTFEYQIVINNEIIPSNCTNDIQNISPTTNKKNDSHSQLLNQSNDNILNGFKDKNLIVIQDPIKYATPNLDDIVNQSIPNNSCANETIVKSIDIEETELGRNPIYRTIFYWFTVIMVTILPLVLLATFNCCLINAVYKSQTQRDKMTNSQERKSQTQENRITVTLIAVVILFLVCQTPTACMLIYTTLHHYERGSSEDYIIRGLGNLFNLLMAVNAACNFLLYCAFSDKYRRTFKTVFMGKKFDRHDTLYESSTASSRLTNSKRFHVNGAGLKRNTSEYAQRYVEAERLKRIARTKSMLAKPLSGSSSPTATNVTYY